MFHSFNLIDQRYLWLIHALSQTPWPPTSSYAGHAAKSGLGCSQPGNLAQDVARWSAHSRVEGAPCRMLLVRTHHTSWLVVLTILKNTSQWERLSHILWKIETMFETTNQHHVLWSADRRFCWEHTSSSGEILSMRASMTSHGWPQLGPPPHQPGVTMTSTWDLDTWKSC